MFRTTMLLVTASLALAACQSSGPGAGNSPGIHANETHEEAIRRIEREGAETRRRSGTP